MKKLITLALCMILLCSAMITPISAATGNDEIAQPYWTNTVSISALINFVDGVGYAEAVLNGRIGSSETLIDVIVYRQSGDNWIYITEKHVSANGESVAVCCEFIPTIGTNYKAEYTFTVYKNGTGEVVKRDVLKTYNG